jgi:hypothetical protein
MTDKMMQRETGIEPATSSLGKLAASGGTFII